MVARAHSLIRRLWQILGYANRAILSKRQTVYLAPPRTPLYQYILLGYRVLDLELVWLNYSMKCLIRDSA